MKTRIATMLLLSVVWLVCGPARAQQIPGTEQLKQKQQIKISAKKTTKQKVAGILEALEQKEKDLLQEQTNLLQWKDDLEAANSRLDELHRLLDEVKLKNSPEGGLEEAEAAAPLAARGGSDPATGDAPQLVAGDIDPALQPQLERSVDLHSGLSENLSFLIETFGQEQREVSEGIRHARQLVERLENPPPLPGADEKQVLDEVLRYLGDLHRARISLSLLKARRAGLNEELEQRLKDQKEPPQLPPLAEFGGNPSSRQLTLELRDEFNKALPKVASHAKTLRVHVAGHIEAQLNRVRLEIYERSEDLKMLEENREQVFDSLTVSEDDLDAAEGRLASAMKRIGDSEREVRRELKTLRLSPPGAEEPGSFTQFKKWQIHLSVLQHHLYLVDVERQVEKFRAASLPALHELVRSRPPSHDFIAGYAYYLDAARQAKARGELDKRREAWRQEYSHLSLEDPVPGEEALAAEILEGYKNILDLYDQIGARKWEMEWCAELVRYHQTLYEVSKRDAWWYTWRILVSLFLLAAAIFLSIMLGRGTLKPIRKRQDASGWLRYTLFLTYIFGVLLLWTFLAVLTLTNVWGALFGFDRIGGVFAKTLFVVGDKEISLYAIASLLAVIAVTVLVNRFIGRFLRQQVFAYFRWDEGIRHAVAAVVRYLVLFAGIALGLEFIGIGLGALALFAGVIGIGIGFGLQTIANNFISGLIILFERPIKKGDFVDAGGLEGRVEEIQARATTLVTRDNVSVIVPNSEFVGGQVVNWSHGSDTVRLHIPVGVAYGSDVETVRKVLRGVADAHGKVLRHPEAKVWFMGFGDSSLDFELLVWTEDFEAKYQTASDLNYAIDKAFREQGITIPFPQRDLHIKSDDRPPFEKL